MVFKPNYLLYHVLPFSIIKKGIDFLQFVFIKEVLDLITSAYVIHTFEYAGGFLLQIYFIFILPYRMQLDTKSI